MFCVDWCVSFSRPTIPPSPYRVLRRGSVVNASIGLGRVVLCGVGLIRTAESLIDKALEMRYIGGVYGNQRPTEFLCLLLKLLQIQPEKEILVEYLQADEFKCVFTPPRRALLGSRADIYGWFWVSV